MPGISNYNWLDILDKTINKDPKLTTKPISKGVPAAAKIQPRVKQVGPIPVPGLNAGAGTPMPDAELQRMLQDSYFDITPETLVPHPLINHGFGHVRLDELPYYAAPQYDPKRLGGA